MSELDTSGSVEGLGKATSPVYSTTPKIFPSSDKRRSPSTELLCSSISSQCGSSKYFCLKLIREMSHLSPTLRTSQQSKACPYDENND